MTPEQVLNHYREIDGIQWPNISRWIVAKGHEYIEMKPDENIRKVLMVYTSKIMETYFDGEEAGLIIWNGKPLKMGHGWTDGAEYFQAQGLWESEAEIVFAFLELYRQRKADAAL